MFIGFVKCFNLNVRKGNCSNNFSRANEFGEVEGLLPSTMVGHMDWGDKGRIVAVDQLNGVVVCIWENCSRLEFDLDVSKTGGTSIFVEIECDTVFFFCGLIFPVQNHSLRFIERFAVITALQDLSRQIVFS